MDIVQLERMMLNYLDTLESDKCHRELGYGPRLPRFKLPETQKEFHEFYDMYLKLRWEVDNLEKIVNEKREEFENKCKHEWEKDWENRDERSRWKCKKCTKFR